MIQLVASDLVNTWPALHSLGFGFDMTGEGAATLYEATNNLGIVIDLFRRLQWEDLADQAARILERAKRGERGEAMMVLTHDLHQAFESKAKKISIVAPVGEDAKLLDNATRALAGVDAETMTEPAQELNLAGRCLALGLPTASVSHAMRCVECSLHRLASQLGITFGGAAPNLQDWAALTEKIQSVVDNFKKQSRSTHKSNALEHLSKLVIHADHFRLAWRNHVQHARSCYSEHEARKVLVHVGAYLAELASCNIPTVP